MDDHSNIGVSIGNTRININWIFPWQDVGIYSSNIGFNLDFYSSMAFFSRNVHSIIYYFDWEYYR